MLSAESNAVAPPPSTGGAKKAPKTGKATKDRPEKGHTKRWTWKKPGDKPKRNLSAYNFFFQEQRQLILKEREQCAEEQATIASKGGIRLGFDTLARTVATRWRNLDPNLLDHYKALAQRDRDRYQGELAVWTQKRALETKLEEQRIAEETKCDGTTSAKEPAVSLEDQRLSQGAMAFSYGHGHPESRSQPPIVVPDAIPLSPTNKNAYTDRTHATMWNSSIQTSHQDAMMMASSHPPPTAQFEPNPSISSGMIVKGHNYFGPIKSPKTEASFGKQDYVGQVPRLDVQGSHLLGNGHQFQISNSSFSAHPPMSQMDAKPSMPKVEALGSTTPHGYAGVFTMNSLDANKSFGTFSNAAMLSGSNPTHRHEHNGIGHAGSSNDVKMSAMPQNGSNDVYQRPLRHTTGLDLILAAVFDEKDSENLVAYTSAAKE